MSSRITHVETPIPVRLLRSGSHSLLFAILLWLSAAAGAIPVPGTPVPVTLQTFVLMVAALSLPWTEAAGAVITYLAAGAAGLPVFAGGASTLALMGPSAGFLWGFLPGIIIAALLKGEAHTQGAYGYAITAGRYLLACIVGCVLVVYAVGFLVQSSVTGVPLGAVALASTAFVIGDIVKAVIASLAVSGLVRLR